MGILSNLPSLDEARALGATLRRIDPSLLKPTPHERRWYRGGEPYLEVTVDEDDAGVIMLELYVRGRFARFTRDQGVETGATDELQTTDGAPGSKTESRDPSQASAVLDAARAILDGNDELRTLAPLLTDRR